MSPSSGNGCILLHKKKSYIKANNEKQSSKTINNNLSGILILILCGIILAFSLSSLSTYLKINDNISSNDNNGKLFLL